MKLYEITKEIEELLEQYNTVEDDAVRAAIERELDTKFKNRDEKLANVCAVAKNLESDLEQYDSEIKRLKTQRDSIKKHIERLRNYITSNLGVGNKWEHGVHKLSWRKSKALVIDESKGVYPEFQRVIYEVNREAAREHLEGGGSPLPFAWIEERENLQIK